eukprot:5311000-Prymnesium_polylepis.1
MRTCVCQRRPRLSEACATTEVVVNHVIVSGTIDAALKSSWWEFAAPTKQGRRAHVFTHYDLSTHLATTLTQRSRRQHCRCNCVRVDRVRAVTLTHTYGPTGCAPSACHLPRPVGP